MQVKLLEPNKLYVFLQEYIHIFQIISRGPPTQKLSNPMTSFTWSY